MARVKLSQFRLLSPFFKKKKNSNNNNGQGSIQKIRTAPSRLSVVIKIANDWMQGSLPEWKDALNKLTRYNPKDIKKLNDGNDGDDGDDGDDDDNNSGGGDENKKKGGGSGDGESNGDGGDKAEGGDGRKEKGMNKDCTGQLGFRYKARHHAGQLVRDGEGSSAVELHLC